MQAFDSTPPPDHVFADDARAYHAGAEAHGRREALAELVVTVLIAAAGGPFVQRRPTAAECRTAALDHFADKWRDIGPHFVGSRMVRARLEQLGLTVQQVEAWALKQMEP